MEIPEGRGVLKAKILEAKYEAKLEFPGGGGGGWWGVQNKESSVLLSCGLFSGGRGGSCVMQPLK